MTKATCSYTSRAVSQPESLEAAQTSAASVVSGLDLGPGASPAATLRSLRVQPITFRMARTRLVRRQYLRLLPGGASLTLRGAGRQAPHGRRTSS